MRRFFVLSSAFVTMAVGVAWAAEPLKSGPQVGSELPGPFHPLNVNGENAGQKSCLYCRYGGDPVAFVFAGRNTPEVAQLIKLLEAATQAHKAADLGGCVIFCSADESLKGQLEALAKKEGLKNIILAIDEPAGPEEYKVAKDADVTVLLCKEKTVKVNYAFRKGELNDKAIAQIVADLPKIVK
ncbi:MAG: hypothetical protein ACJ8F7_03415 [Gemmataceae bacterium]